MILQLTVMFERAQTKELLYHSRHAIENKDKITEGAEKWVISDGCQAKEVSIRRCLLIYGAFLPNMKR